MSKDDRPILNLSNALHRKLLIADIKSREGLHEVRIVRLQDQRSLSQQGYLFGVVYPLIAPVLSAAYDQTFDRVRTHYWLKNEYLLRELVNVQTGEVRHEAPAFDSLTVEEVSVYIDQCIKFADESGVTIPPAAHYQEA